MRKSEVKKNVELTLILAMREIKGRYKGSLLGPAWVIAYPFFLTAITTLVFSYFIKIQTDPIPYPLFALCGILFWNFFTKTINLGTRSLTMNRDLIVETSIDAKLLPLSYILGAIPDFLINFAILAVFLGFSGFSFSWSSLLILPIFFLFCIFIFGMALFLSTINVLYKDAQNLLDPILLVWFYVTPIFYPPSLVSEKFQWIVWINPIANAVTIFRNLLFLYQMPSSTELLLLLGASLASAMIGFWTFQKYRPIFADII